MSEAKAMKEPHRYVLFNPQTGQIMRAEDAQHFVVPLCVVSAGDEAIVEWCKAHPKKAGGKS